MAVQNRLMGWAATVAQVGHDLSYAPNLLEYFKEIEINLDVAMMEARVPHDSVVNGGAHYPRPKSRKLDITVSATVPGETNNVTGVAADNLFDVGLFGVGDNTDCQFSFNTGGLILSGVGMVTGADLSYPGEEAMQTIKITARSYTGNRITSHISIV